MLSDDSLSTGWGCPEEEIGSNSFLWLHVPARGSLDVTILSASPVRYKGHWAGGRMQPCKGADCCRWCELRMGGQVRYAMAVWDNGGDRGALLEVGPRTATDLQELMKVRSGKLRGLRVTLTKEGGADRGAIRASFGGPHGGPLPDDYDVAEHLRRAWEREEKQILTLQQL